MDFATTDLLAAVWDADLVILCTPLAQMRSRVREMLPALKRGAIVTDVGSVKASVVRELESLIQKSGAHFVGSHPMAGAEKTGVSAARADLFVNAVCVVTPTKKTNQAALKKVEQFWKAMGSRVLRIDAGNARRAGQPVEPFAARRRGDFGQPCFESGAAEASGRACARTVFATRRASRPARPKCGATSPWPTGKTRPKSLDAFIADLQKFRRLMKKGDAKAIAKFFETAKKRRDNWCAGCASPSPE